MKILVTGFEPFGKNTVNPSMEVLAKLNNCDKILLSVSYNRVYYHTLNKLSKTIFIHLPTYDELS